MNCRDGSVPFVHKYVLLQYPVPLSPGLYPWIIILIVLSHSLFDVLYINYGRAAKVIFDTLSHMRKLEPTSSQHARSLLKALC